MSSTVGSIAVGVGYYTEIGATTQVSGTYRLKNLGAAVAFVTHAWNGDTTAYNDQQTTPGAWPLVPGDEMTVQVPSYPITGGAYSEQVPVAVAVGTGEVASLLYTRIAD